MRTHVYNWKCTHVHTPAYTQTSTLTACSVYVLTLHSCSPTTYAHTCRQMYPQVHTHTYTPFTDTYIHSYTHIYIYTYTHHSIHWEGFFFFLNCWNRWLFQIGNIAAALFPPEASFSSHPRSLCHHLHAQVQVEILQLSVPTPAPTSPALSCVCQAHEGLFQVFHHASGWGCVHFCFNILLPPGIFFASEEVK